MTPKQMYTALSKIAGHPCGDGRPFVVCKRVSKPHIEIIQQRIMALLEKLNYGRTRRDFSPAYREQHPPQMSRRRMLRAQRMAAQDAGRDRIGGPPIPETPLYNYVQAHPAQPLRREPAIARIASEHDEWMPQALNDGQMREQLAQDVVDATYMVMPPEMMAQIQNITFDPGVPERMIEPDISGISDSAFSDDGEPI